MDYYRGKPIDQMTREELIAALKEMDRLYRAALDEPMPDTVTIYPRSPLR